MSVKVAAEMSAVTPDGDGSGGEGDGGCGDGGDGGGGDGTGSGGDGGGGGGDRAGGGWPLTPRPKTSSATGVRRSSVER